MPFLYRPRFPALMQREFRLNQVTNKPQQFWQKPWMSTLKSHRSLTATFRRLDSTVVKTKWCIFFRVFTNLSSLMLPRRAHEQNRMFCRGRAPLRFCVAGIRPNVVSRVGYMCTCRAFKVSPHKRRQKETNNGRAIDHWHRGLMRSMLRGARWPVIRVAGSFLRVGGIS